MESEPLKILGSDGGRSPHPRQYPPGQRLRQPAGNDSRFDKRHEGVDIVAGHDCPRGRQRVHDVRVAVVHDMEDVEARHAALQPARIVPESIDVAADAGTTWRERRSKHLDLNRHVEAAGMELILEHVGDQAMLGHRSSRRSATSPMRSVGVTGLENECRRTRRSGGA